MTYCLVLDLLVGVPEVVSVGDRARTVAYGVLAGASGSDRTRSQVTALDTAPVAFFLLVALRLVSLLRLGLDFVPLHLN